MTNVLVIHADDLRLDVADRFMPRARRRFDHEFAAHRVNTPVCGPERAGFLTGQVSKDHDVYAANGSDKAGGGTLDITTDILPTWLSAAGTTTAVFGKYIQTIDAARSGPWDHARMLVNNGAIQNSFDYSVWDGAATSQPGLEQPGVYVEDYMAGELTSWLSTVTEPWFAWWTPTTPHVTQSGFGNYPHPDDVNRFAFFDWPLTTDPDLSDKPTWLQGGSETIDYDAMRGRRAQIRRHLAELQALDRAIDAVFAALAAEAMLDDTIVAFTSDNGLHFAEMGFNSLFLASKNVLYEYAVHGPLWMTGPGIPAGRTTIPTFGQDLTALAVAVAGAVPTGRPNQAGIDPRDLIVNAGGAHSGRQLLHAVRNVAAPFPAGETAVGISTETRKLIRWEAQAGTDRYELYDLDVDPDEWVNVANDPGRLAERNALEADLDAMLA